jgi:hypothetical protein
MSQNIGIRTQTIAEELQKKLVKTNINVFFDHGDSKTNSNVCRPTAYIGKRYGGDATVSSVDIVLEKDGVIIGIVEIEESDATRPKIIIGNIFSVIISDQIMINKKSYKIKDAFMVVGVVVSGKGKREGKYIRIQRLLKKRLPDYYSSRPEQRISKVRIITTTESDLVRRIERLVRRYL